MSLKFKFLATAVAVSMLVVTALPAAALAQSSYDTSYDYSTTPTREMTPEEAAAAGTATMVALAFEGCLFVVIYVYMAITIAATAKKVGMTDGLWMAWVPFANVYLMTKIAKLEILHCILSFVIPFWILYVYAKMFERRGMSPWMVLLFFIPFGAFVAMGMLAWSNNTPAAQPAVA